IRDDLVTGVQTCALPIFLKEGRIEVAAIGEELHNVYARVVMKPWGTVRVEDVRAEGVSGKLTAAGTAQIDGLTFKQAQGQVRIEIGRASCRERGRDWE